MAAPKLTDCSIAEALPLLHCHTLSSYKRIVVYGGVDMGSADPDLSECLPTSPGGVYDSGVYGGKSPQFP